MDYRSSLPGWTVVRAGFHRCAQRSPTGLRSRPGQAPILVAAIVSPRLKPEDNPVAGTQTRSKRAMSLWQRQKVQKYHPDFFRSLTSSRILRCSRVCSFFDNWRISTTRQRSDWRVQRKCHTYFTPSGLSVARRVLSTPCCKNPQITQPKTAECHPNGEIKCDPSLRPPSSNSPFVFLTK